MCLPRSINDLLIFFHGSFARNETDIIQKEVLTNTFHLANMTSLLPGCAPWEIGLLLYVLVVYGELP